MATRELIGGAGPYRQGNLATPPALSRRGLLVCLTALVPWLLLTVAVLVGALFEAKEDWGAYCDMGEVFALFFVLALLVIQLTIVVPVALWMKKHRSWMERRLYLTVVHGWRLSAALLGLSVAVVGVVDFHITSRPSPGSYPYSYCR